MKIGVVCGYPIPCGMAATTRIFSYTKGVVAKGGKAEVFSYIPSGINKDGYIEDSGYFEGVKYIYTYRRKKSKKYISKLLEVVYSLIKLPIELYKSNQKERFDAILVSTDTFYIQGYLALINLVLKAKLIFIFDEFPIPIRGKLAEKIPNWKIYAYKAVLKSYSGYVSMTQELLNYYQKISFHKGLVLSTITDTSRFDATSDVDLHKNIRCYKIVYMGNMELSKDNVDNILLSLTYIPNQYHYHLYLYGNPSPSDKNKLQKIIIDNNLSKCVSFDFVPYRDVPRRLKEADILVSSQPITKRAAGGFPTKLGEYLMTGKPVLLTDVGETSKFFSNHTQIFFAQPNSPEDFARELIYIFNNYTKALAVGKEGKTLIEKEFSHVIAGEKICNFIKAL